MSDATLQAVHDAIAAHIADVNEDDPEFLTEWVFIASAAISTDTDATSYYVYDSNIPLHHALGLIHYGKRQISAGVTADED
jgi:hypothetical protein